MRLRDPMLLEICYSAPFLTLSGKVEKDIPSKVGYKLSVFDSETGEESLKEMINQKRPPARSW
jgi:hypothetical protein